MYISNFFPVWLTANFVLYHKDDVLKKKDQQQILSWKELVLDFFGPREC